MDYTYHDLKHMKVTELRDIASGLDDELVKGYTQVNKDHLVEMLCKAMNIEMHAHHEVVGLNKGPIKKKIRELKKKRDEALKNKDKKTLLVTRSEIKELKTKLRSAMV